MRVHIDLETRSAADLRKVGQYVYAAHPTTEIIVVCYAIDAGPVQTWIPTRSTAPGEPMPFDLATALETPEVLLVAHNAGFERNLVSSPAGARIGFPAGLEAVERWNCTAARAAAIGLPRSLDGAGAALGLAIQKDKEGAALMLRMCKPRAPRKGEAPGVYWWDDADRMARLAAYCARDVEVERAIDDLVPALLPEERATWELTERMNDRGILVDTALLDAAARLIDEAEADLGAEISERTGGAVPAITNSGAISRWLTAQGIEGHIAADTRKASVAKAQIAAMLENEALDPFIREVLILRRDGGGSSSKKWRAIKQRLSADGRARGSLVYCGASATGRWSARGIQLQNLPRGGTVKNILGAVDDVIGGACAGVVGLLHGPALIVASEMLRPAFIAEPGKWLARGDYSQIEARVNPWLAGAADTLDAFRAYDTIIGEEWSEKDGKMVPVRAGPDLYRVTAAGLLQVQIEAVTKEQRQTGKVASLALGFGGGAGALQNMAKAYGMKIPRHPKTPEGLPLDVPGGPAEGSDEWIKRRWRASNPEICGLWYGLEAAALDCMNRPAGDVVEVWTAPRAPGCPKHLAPLSFRRNARALCMRLPSGRGLYYWSPRMRKVETPFGQKWTLFYRAEDSVTHQWKEWPAWHGIFCENAVQAVARDIMRDALLRLYSSGILPVLTVHDEGIAEIAASSAKEAAEIVEAAMRVPPPWADGLPISADSSAARRYIKED